MRKELKNNMFQERRGSTPVTTKSNLYNEGTSSTPIRNKRIRSIRPISVNEDHTNNLNGYNQ